LTTPGILGFLSGDAPDHAGRFVGELQQWPDQRLEAVHDFIQWMFPLKEASPVNPLAPVLDAAALEELRRRAELRARVQENTRASYLRMRRFYEGSWHWVTPGNHNHLRITRILKSLRLLGLEAEAGELFGWLETVHQEEKKKTRPGIGERSFEFWRQAMAAGSPATCRLKARTTGSPGLSSGYLGWNLNSEIPISSLPCTRN
jgi:hypothetical protein